MREEYVWVKYYLPCFLMIGEGKYSKEEYLSYFLPHFLPVFVNYIHLMIHIVKRRRKEEERRRKEDERGIRHCHILSSLPHFLPIFFYYTSLDHVLAAETCTRHEPQIIPRASRFQYWVMRFSINFVKGTSGFVGRWKTD